MNTNIQHGAIDPSMAGAAVAPTQKRFKPMGYRGPNYYFHVKATNQVVVLKIGQFRSPWIFRLAELDWWKQVNPTNDKRCVDGVRWSEVASDLISQCLEAGEFQGVAYAKNAPIQRTAKGEA